MKVFFSDGVYSDFALIYWCMAQLLVHWKAENLHAASWKILQVQWSCRSSCGRTKYCSSCDASHWAVRCTNVDKVICCAESAELGRQWRRDCKKWTEKGMVFLECWYTCSYCMFYSMWSVHDCVHDLCVNVCTAKSITSKPFSFRNPVMREANLQCEIADCAQLLWRNRRAYMCPWDLGAFAFEFRTRLPAILRNYVCLIGLFAFSGPCALSTSVSTWGIAHTLFCMRYMLLYLCWCVTNRVLEKSFLLWFYFCPSQKASDSATKREWLSIIICDGFCCIQR